MEDACGRYCLPQPGDTEMTGSYANPWLADRGRKATVVKQMGVGLLHHVSPPPSFVFLVHVGYHEEESHIHSQALLMLNSCKKLMKSCPYCIS